MTFFLFCISFDPTLERTYFLQLLEFTFWNSQRGGCRPNRTKPRRLVHIVPRLGLALPFAWDDRPVDTSECFDAWLCLALVISPCTSKDSMRQPTFFIHYAGYPPIPGKAFQLVLALGWGLLQLSRFCHHFKCTLKGGALPHLNLMLFDHQGSTCTWLTASYTWLVFAHQGSTSFSLISSSFRHAIKYVFVGPLSYLFESLAGAKKRL